MQHKITRIEENFKPIKIEVIIENKEELENLLIRLNASTRLFDGTGYDKIQKADTSLNNLWDELDDIAIELGLSDKEEM